MLIVAVWWLWMEVIGLAAWPLAYRFFRRLPDRGYCFARPLGLLLTSYVLWLGGSLGIVRNSLGGALFSLGVVAVGSGVFYWRRRDAERRGDDPGLVGWLRANKGLVVCVELLFAGALAIWALLRAYSPELTTAGGEKFMEIMYLNSIGRSEYFPPHDAWLSGYAISYYYFGYVMVATLTMLSGFAAHLTFNVGVALLFALTCTGAFGLVYNLVRLPGGEGRARRERPLAWGLLGAVLVTVLGNLEGFLEVLYGNRLLPQGFWRWLDIQELNEAFGPAAGAGLLPSRSGWWWWRASRVIHDLDPAGQSMGIQPIDEFPSFSFLLGDMHPHVLALPFVLLALAVALGALLESGDEPAEREVWWAPVRRLSLLVPVCLGALGFLNTWDLPIYWLVFTICYGLGRWRRHGGLSRNLLRDVGVTGGAAAVLSVLFYLPFYVGFQSQAGGILPTLYVGTRFRQYVVMFGPFLLAIGGLLAAQARRAAREVPARRLVRGWVGWTAALVVVPLAAMMLVVLVMLVTPAGREFLEGIRRVPEVYQIVGDEAWGGVLVRLLAVKLRTWVMPVVVGAMAAMGVVLLRWWVAPSPLPLSRGETGETALQFVLVCAVVGLLLTLSVEFVYLVDVFRVRMNTVFKFYFQAWVLMGVGSAYAVYWLSRRRGVLRSVVLAAFWLLFGLGMVFPLLANVSRAGSFDHAPMLDGTAYLAESQPSDYAAIRWLNEQVPGALVILEAPGSGGSSYVYEGRVSALTGLPTLLGWGGHETQWRGDSSVQSARDPDIKRIFTTLDAGEAAELLDRYEVTFVYVGPLERSTYDPRGLEKFGRFMDVVYEQDGVTIYRVRGGEGG